MLKRIILILLPDKQSIRVLPTRCYLPKLSWKSFPRCVALDDWRSATSYNRFTVTAQPPLNRLDLLQSLPFKNSTIRNIRRTEHNILGGLTKNFFTHRTARQQRKELEMVRSSMNLTLIDIRRTWLKPHANSLNIRWGWYGSGTR